MRVTGGVEASDPQIELLVGFALNRLSWRNYGYNYMCHSRLLPSTRRRQRPVYTAEQSPFMRQWTV